MDYLLKGLAWYVFPVNSLSKQKRTMCRCIKRPHSLKVRLYAACLICLDEYLASFPGETMADNMGKTGLDKNILNSIPKSCSKQAYIRAGPVLGWTLVDIKKKKKMRSKKKGIVFF